MQAAEETGRKLKVYAVEKNPNAVITLHVSYGTVVVSHISLSFHWMEAKVSHCNHHECPPVYLWFYHRS